MVDLDERLQWFKSVILPHEGALRSRLRRMAPAGADVDDLIAESLARAWTAHEWSRISEGRAYLFMIARNMLIDAARRDAVVSFDQVADFDTLRHDYRPEPQLDARDELRRLEKIIADLPAQAGRVFVLRRIQGFSMNEIAERMGLSVSTVEKHLAKALACVARMLAETEDWSVESAVRDTGQEDRTRGSCRAAGCPGS